MKIFLLIALFIQIVSLPQVSATPMAHPGNYPFPPMPPDELMKKKVKIDVQNADNDEFLMTFAKAADLNILVDATDAPTDAPLINITEENSIINFAFDFAKYRGYDTQRFSTDTLLFWPQSDKKALARQLLEANKERWSKELAAASPPESTKRTVLLRDYFEKNLGWNGKWEGVDLRIKVKDLPPNLQALILSEMNAQISYRISNVDRLLFRMGDDFWRKSKLSIKQGLDREALKKDNRIMVPYLVLNDKQLKDTPQDANHPFLNLEIGPLLSQRR